MIRFFAAICICLTFISVSAQDFNNYKPIESTGTIPDDFLTRTSRKVFLDRHKTENSSGNREKKDKLSFLIESNYLIDELLFSGKVLFNDPISNYANRVLDELLKNDKELRGKLRVYTIKSTAVNAFATDNGIIFVTTGLLAQLENEAQLAYVLAHEVTHYEYDHSMNAYLETQKIARQEGVYRDSKDIDDKLLRRNNYSRELETEADMHGLEIYLKSNYSVHVLNGVFDVLEYAYLPFDEVEFDRSFLETEHIKFPETYFLEELKPIAGETDFDEAEATHPSVQQRRKTLMAKIKDIQDAKNEFLVSKEDFYTTRKIARYELVRLHMLDREYGKSLYSTYILLNDDPSSKYLKKAMLQSLYGLTKYSNQSSKYKVIDDYDDVEGQSQQLIYLLDQITANEMNVIALVKAMELEKEYPEDAEISKMADDLMNELTHHHYKSLEDFYEKPLAEMMADTLKPPTEEASVSADSSAKSLSKYEKIRKQRQEQKTEKIEEGSYYILFAFVDLLKNEDFVNRFNKSSEEDVIKKKSDNELTYRERKEQSKRLKRDGFKMGIDKIVLVDPIVIKVRPYKRNKKVNYMELEQKQLEYNEVLQAQAQNVGLDVVFIDEKMYEGTDVDKFNEMALLAEWFNEVNEADDNYFVTINSDRMKALAEKYGTPYFTWTGRVTTVQKADNAAFLLFYTIVMFPLLPYGIYRVLKNEPTTTFVTFIYNAEKEKNIAIMTNSVNKHDQSDVVNANVYDIFNQIKKKN